MTKKEAIAVATLLMDQEQLQYAGFRKAIFVPRDDPLNLVILDSDKWLILFDFSPPLILPGIDLDHFTVDVDCATGKASILEDL